MLIVMECVALAVLKLLKLNSMANFASSFNFMLQITSNWQLRLGSALLHSVIKDK